MTKSFREEIDEWRKTGDRYPKFGDWCNTFETIVTFEDEDGNVYETVHQYFKYYLIEDGEVYDNVYFIEDRDGNFILIDKTEEEFDGEEDESEEEDCNNGSDLDAVEMSEEQDEQEIEVDETDDESEADRLSTEAIIAEAMREPNDAEVQDIH